MTDSIRPDANDRLLVAGIFFLATALYSLLGPGRIDIIDGQWRYEIAHNILTHGSVTVQDEGLIKSSVPGENGARYSFYGFSGSIVAVPFIAIGETLAPANRDLAQFLFSIISAVFSAATLALLYRIYREFGIARSVAMGWSVLMGFATLFLPLATSVFDQTQNAFLILLSFFCAFLTRRSGSIATALLGGAAFVILINYKEAYAILWPGLLVTAGLNISPRTLKQIRSSRALQIYIAAGLIGISLWAGYNLLRFGQISLPRVPGLHPPIFGNPALGFLGLTISPGKGLLWYSPVVILALFGWRRFWETQPEFAKGALTAIAFWVYLISFLSFYGGDWCWGPRYWVPVLPLIFLAAPFAPRINRMKRIAATGIVTASLAIQCMAIAVDHQRFFFSRSLFPFFWYDNTYFYFENSALISRPGEILQLRSLDTKYAPGHFRPGPHPESLTYAIFGPAKSQDLNNGSRWMESFPVFSLPRPWPLWTSVIDEPTVAKARSVALVVFELTGMLGLALISISWIRVQSLVARRASTG